MVEILDIEEIWALIRKLYEKKKEGWTAYSGMTESRLIDFILRGPDAVIEIVQDSPGAFMFGDISRLPRPWRPLGKGIVLDEDPTRIPSTDRPYGLRPMSKRTFERYMEIVEMAYKREAVEKIARLYNEMVSEHVRTPVVSRDEIGTPVASIGPFNYQPSLMDISPSQRKLRAKLESQVRAMQRKRVSYVG